MRAHQIMTRSVITIAPDATILKAAKTMLQHRVSGLPVVDTAGRSGRSRPEERRVGKECPQLCRSRWSPYH